MAVLLLFSHHWRRFFNCDSLCLFYLNLSKRVQGPERDIHSIVLCVVCPETFQEKSHEWDCHALFQLCASHSRQDTERPLLSHNTHAVALTELLTHTRTDRKRTKILYPPHVLIQENFPFFRQHNQNSCAIKTNGRRFSLSSFQVFSLFSEWKTLLNDCVHWMNAKTLQLTLIYHHRGSKRERRLFLQLMLSSLPLVAFLCEKLSAQCVCL